MSLFLSEFFLITLPIVLIIILGVPHGVFDLSLSLKVANNLENDHRLSLGIFSAYLLLIVTSFTLWQLLPTVCFLVFLLMTINHFGRAELQESSMKFSSSFLQIVATFVHGATVLISVYFASEESRYVLSLLPINMLPTEQFFELLMVLMVVCLPIHVYQCAVQKQFDLLVRLSFIFLVCWFLPPLWAFAIYFCAFHTLFHVSLSRKFLSAQWREKRPQFLLFTVLSWVFLAFLATFYRGDVSQISMNILVAGLFALTVPHSLLVDFALPRKYRMWSL